MRLLLISNSTNAGEPYLDYPKYEIKKFLGDIKTVLFIPYAGVTFSYDEYEAKVANRLSEVGIEVKSIHHFTNPVEAAENAEAIVVGGGNTFRLLERVQANGLLDVIRKKVMLGTPYIGWSAGSNLACPTIKTTNDMPVIQPQSFNAFNLVPFQINPHYLDAHPDGHAGETREQRIEEFIELNQDVTVVGLRESCMILVEGGQYKLIGPHPVRVFKFGEKPQEITDLNALKF
ncbi:dipeptidase PepE [Alistipes sp. ZOR0009]|uniref:dipeptidase PepE n=1 Tax=Alistipes sp. ZOR0009 TaxID=1339253 RepID=UPI000645F5A0|nr:dipeptidase PepE [Alistipes sp. ZOR0009]